MPEITVSKQGVIKLLSRLKPSKAAGPDKLPASFLKELSEPLGKILALFFEQTLDEGAVPQDWKRAMVAPIYKKGDRGIAVNYRPVSLTSIACKTQEHITTSQLMDHLDTQDILIDCQPGFRSKHSCETQ